jgi:hypothetical protein
MRLALSLLALVAVCGCAQPGFLKSDTGNPPPPLLPITDILAPDSAQLDAEATAALTARGEALRDGSTATR